MNNEQFARARDLISGLDSALAALYEDPTDLRVIAQIRADLEVIASLNGDQRPADLLRPLYDWMAS